MRLPSWREAGVELWSRSGREAARAGAVGTSDENVLEVGCAVRDRPLGGPRRTIVAQGERSGGDQPADDEADGNDSLPHRFSPRIFLQPAA